jgi:Transposase DDE domain/Transposase domain (DUF772)
MGTERWTPTTKITKQEEYILKRCRKKRKLFAFLRENRSKLFDAELQEELEGMYRATGAGKEPLCPARMAMALILQGYLGLSDADAVEATVTDLRWQMVLDCLGATAPAFSQGGLFDFRERLIEHDMDRRLLARTAEIARTTRGFDAKKLPKTLRIAIDSSPLEGAGRVEDTINLIAHAARKVVRCVADLLGQTYEDICRQSGIPLLLSTSVKKGLDRDWNDVAQKNEAVDILAKEVLSLERWIERRLGDRVEQPPLDTLLKVLRELMDQDLEPDPDGNALRITEGVANERRISVEDGQMRHGRKSKSKLIDGYKRHIVTDLDSQVILACAVTPANQAEQEALPSLKSDIDAQQIRIREAHFDRAYISSPVVDELEDGGAQIVCKPWASKNTRNPDSFTKRDFDIDLRAMTITCPAGNSQTLRLGTTIYFDADACANCSLRAQCTTAKKGTGRSMAIAEDEPRQEKLRRQLATKKGRQKFRERVPVEHRLAHIGQRQGNRARYLGVRRNLYDLRRAATIQNLETAQRKVA